MINKLALSNCEKMGLFYSLITGKPSPTQYSCHSDEYPCKQCEEEFDICQKKKNNNAIFINLAKFVDTV